jgi:hypothetical protein
MSIWMTCPATVPARLSVRDHDDVPGVQLCLNTPLIYSLKSDVPTFAVRPSMVKVVMPALIMR